MRDNGPLVSVTAVGFWAVICCCLFGGCGGDQVLALASQLQSDDVGTRRHAARALVEMKQAAEPALPELSAALRDDDPQVRRLASRAVGQLGDVAKSCLPELQEWLTDDDLSTRLAAAFAIHDLDPAEEQHTRVLIEAMILGEGGVIVAAGRQGEQGGWAVPTLIGLLKDRRAGIRRISADALGQIGKAAGEAEETLRKLAEQDTDDRVRNACKEAAETIAST